MSVLNWFVFDIKIANCYCLFVKHKLNQLSILNLNFEPIIVSIHITPCFFFLWHLLHSVYWINGIPCWVHKLQSTIHMILVSPQTLITATATFQLAPCIIPFLALIRHLMIIHWCPFCTFIMLPWLTPITLVVQPIILTLVLWPVTLVIWQKASLVRSPSNAITSWCLSSQCLSLSQTHGVIRLRPVMV